MHAETCKALWCTHHVCAKHLYTLVHATELTSSFSRNLSTCSTAWHDTAHIINRVPCLCAHHSLVCRCLFNGMPGCGSPTDLGHRADAELLTRVQIGDAPKLVFLRHILCTHVAAQKISTVCV